jgi:hypothetical protein
MTNFITNYYLSSSRIIITCFSSSRCVQTKPSVALTNAVFFSTPHIITYLAEHGFPVHEHATASQFKYDPTTRAPPHAHHRTTRSPDTIYYRH